MQKKYLLCLIQCFVCTWALAGRFIDVPPGTEVVPGEYIVVFKENSGIVSEKILTPETKNRIRDNPSEKIDLISKSAFGQSHRLMSEMKKIKQKGPIAGEIEDEVKAVYTAGLNGFHSRLSRRGLTHILNDESVDYVMPDIVTHTLDAAEPAPNWGADRIDQVKNPLDGIYQYRASGRDVNVVVLDTGINRTHQDFEGRIAGGHNFIAKNNNYSDDNGHGTRMAGIIGGKTGIAKNVNFWIGKVADSTGSGQLSTIITGIQWAIELNEPKTIVNISVGVNSTVWYQPLSSVLRDAYSRGLMVVAGAGNESVDSCTQTIPRAIYFDRSDNHRLYGGYAYYQFGLVAGATDSNDQRIPRTNWGNCISYFAPGIDIRAPTIGGTNAYTSTNAAGQVLFGTSESAAFLTGAEALRAEVYGPWGYRDDRSSQWALGNINSQITTPQAGTLAINYNPMVYTGYIVGGYTGSVPPHPNTQPPASGQPPVGGSGGTTNPPPTPPSVLSKVVSAFMYFFK